MDTAWISADLLREARLRAGLSQAELARRAGQHRSAIGRWERGEARPSLETLVELVRACGLELGFRLSNGDQAHDLALIRRALNTSPRDRLLHTQRATRAALRLRQRATPTDDG